MKRVLLVIGVGLVVFLGWFYFSRGSDSEILRPGGDGILKEKPLDKYAMSLLVEREYLGSQIVTERVLDEEEGFTAYVFSYLTEGKKVTGQINIPVGEGPYPIIVMLRGFVPAEIYQIGMGTRNAAAYFASRGYVTIAPDFLGYGESDEAGEDTFAARLKKPVAVLDLLASLSTLSQVDQTRVFIWGHSNGGQIALAVLEILGKSDSRKLPSVKATTLWAPVTKPFPYSILYYTDESDDRGKELRRVLADFEENYDVYKYSIERYWEWIESPLQVHQGTADDAVPREWSSEFVEELRELEKEVTYYEYPGADHDMRPSWGLVVERDLVFFSKY